MARKVFAKRVTVFVIIKKRQKLISNSMSCLTQIVMEFNINDMLFEPLSVYYWNSITVETIY
jgi:hypothetical protein